MSKKPLSPRGHSAALILCMVGVAPFLGGAEGGCGPAFSRDPAPDMSGQWNVAYANDLSVRITIGAGAARRTYDRTLDAGGGTFDVPLTPDGNEMVTFDLNCSDPNVVCPSEVWPSQVSFRQDNEEFTHRVFLQVPRQECMGDLVAPAASECGAGTLNPNCEDVCTGDVTTVLREAFGTIRDDESGFDVLLGAGVASNGINCAMLSVSVAQGDLVTTGAAETEDWLATDVTNGEVVTGYAGGCLWAQNAGTPAEPSVEAVVIGASIELRTSYTATRP